MFTNRKRLQYENLEPRMALSSVGWDGPGRGHADLTYYIGNVPSYLNQSTVASAVKTALDAWAKVADITFTPTARPGLANSIDISFARLDGSGGTLAQAYFPADVNRSRIAGDVQFDTSERWEVGNGQGNSAFDLVLVAVHEIGHALGLDHSSTRDSVMAASVSPNQRFTGLMADDVNEVLALYAPAKTISVASGPTSQSNGGTSTGNPTANDNPTTEAGDRIPTWPRWTSFWFSRIPRRFWGGFRTSLWPSIVREGRLSVTLSRSALLDPFNASAEPRIPLLASEDVG
jgi:hypothetical protein